MRVLMSSAVVGILALSGAFSGCSTNSPKTSAAGFSDSDLERMVTAKLIGNSETPARKVNVDVVDGVVTLRGVVETATAKEEAERVAKTTDGVKRVRNLLKVV